MRKAVDDAAGSDQVGALLGGADGRVDGTAANQNRTADQSHGGFIRAGYQNQLDVQPLALEKTLLARYPERAIPERLR